MSPFRSVPAEIPRPHYVPSNPDEVMGKQISRPEKPEIKNAVQIAGMREACAKARDILQEAGEHAKPGTNTDHIDQIVHEACIRAGGYPSPLLYKTYPKSCCTSVNNVACHGIPDDQELTDGDIINIDVTIFYKSFHGDTSATFLVGNVDPGGVKLVDIARHCRDTAISVCGPGVEYSLIGDVIQTLAEEQGYTSIPVFCGHGIGEYFHGPPDIIHVTNEFGGRMKEGTTFTIEPIISDGGDGVCIYDDGWTALSTDDSRSAQWEHTILITENGAEILT